MPVPLFAFDTAVMLPYLPYAVGTGVVTALLVAMIARRRAGGFAYRPPVGRGTPGGTGEWEPTEQNIADRLSKPDFWTATTIAEP